jgi:hypothetical protein
MSIVAQIPPLASGPGLIGYECPKCVYVTSVLWRPQGPSEAPNPSTRKIVRGSHRLRLSEKGRLRRSY